MYNRRMDILYQFQGVTFAWDADKAQSNIEKHGVTFEEEGTSRALEAIYWHDQLAESDL